ncbi:MAG TPA: hypothetical protein VGK40_10680 [Verrucomicrobiae bacterium]|jgi:hypothetical protein
MNTARSSAPSGRVAAWHRHPVPSGRPLQRVESVEVIADKGIRKGDTFEPATAPVTLQPPAPAE